MVLSFQFVKILKDTEKVLNWNFQSMKRITDFLLNNQAATLKGTLLIILTDQNFQIEFQELTLIADHPLIGSSYPTLALAQTT